MSTVGYHEGVGRLLDSYLAVPEGEPVRLAKRTSNLFRSRSGSTRPGLDVSGLTGVIDIDPERRTADVAGMCTYEDLVAATLPHGLTPLVVPQLKTITLGGAVTGLGIESTSFRNGLPHESMLELDVLTGAGEVVTASPEGEHADLFRGFPNSYGSLGYATRLRIELEPVRSRVALRHYRFGDLGELLDAVGRIVASREWEGQPVDYLDGVVFTADESYLALGRRSDEAGATSDYTKDRIYYRSIQHDVATPKHDLLTTHDYLWRWDTDWFWCSRAFGAQNPRLRRVWPRRLLRSSVYWRLVALDHRFGIADRIEARNGRPPRERVVQDVEIPLERTEEFLRWFLDEVPIEPIWLCPLRLREVPGDPLASLGQPWSLYPLRRGETYVNVGFWSTVPATPGEPGATNRRIEAAVGALGGHKSLYSDSYYDEDTFDRLYGGAELADLKERYDPKARLLDLYSKAVRRR
ncbi:FAD-binding oxidoreductase [Nostocoides sp. F2B08]|uniref:FAD-binding oxidoreductase n=1 Tax=Nostocoides sp. F2B08 TaxID=2653936 RepID=UPI001D045678|nr:FAD-binding oxidoreductase [Tetrasphaera sp. F2B08]